MVHWWSLVVAKGVYFPENIPPGLALAWSSPELDRMFCCSQSVEKSEVGRIFSCLALISALVKFVSGPMYAIIYDQTLASFPGTFMMVTSLIIFMAMAIMMIVKCLIRYQGGEMLVMKIYDCFEGNALTDICVGCLFSLYYV